MQVRSCETLVILITSTGELLLYFTVIFFSFHIKKKNLVAGLFLGCPASAAGTHFQWIKNSKAISSGSVGKLTDRKWNPHMKSNTVRRVTLGHI